MDFHDIPITSLIPQRPPFVMVDRVLSCNKTDAVTQFAITDDNIFLDDGMLSTAGIVENMAQSCAARMGCINLMRSESVKIGFIGNIRDSRITRRPHCHEQLTTYVRIIEDVGFLTLADVTVKAGDEVLCSASIKIALTEMEAMG